MFKYSLSVYKYRSTYKATFWKRVFLVGKQLADKLS